MLRGRSLTIRTLLATTSKALMIAAWFSSSSVLEFSSVLIRPSREPPLKMSCSWGMCACLKSELESYTQWQVSTHWKKKKERNVTYGECATEFGWWCPVVLQLKAHSIPQLHKLFHPWIGAIHFFLPKILWKLQPEKAIIEFIYSTTW